MLHHIVNVCSYTAYKNICQKNTYVHPAACEPEPPAINVGGNLASVTGGVYEVDSICAVIFCF